MSLKKLFINSDDDNEPKKPKKTIGQSQDEYVEKYQTQIPTSLPTQLPTSLPTQLPTSLPISTTQYAVTETDNTKILSIVDAVRGSYEAGLESLNKPGYDFYEYFKSIQSIKGTSPESYMMAFTLGKSMMPSLTSENLVNDGQYYLNELENAFKINDTKGREALVKIDNQKNGEKESLNNSINNLREQITMLQQQLDEQTLIYNSIEMKYSGEITDTNLKIQINTQIKEEFVKEITTVINNIKNFIK